MERVVGDTLSFCSPMMTVREQSKEQFLLTGSQDLQRLVEKCGNRYHVLNIKDRAHGTLVPELLHQVEKMVTGNRESFYSSQTYLEAEAQVREMEGIIHKGIEERKLREEREMKERGDEEIQHCLERKEREIQKLSLDIRTLKEKITDLEKQLEEERDDKKDRKSVV